MSLTKMQLRELELLSGKQRAGYGLNYNEEMKLRNLIARQNPNARNSDLDQLIALGLIIVDAYTLYKILE